MEDQIETLQRTENLLTRLAVEYGPRVLEDPSPVVQVSALGEFGLSLAVKPWVAVGDYEAAAGEINPAIVAAFRGLDITIAAPPPRSKRGSRAERRRRPGSCGLDRTAPSVRPRPADESEGARAQEMSLSPDGRTERPAPAERSRRCVSQAPGTNTTNASSVVASEMRQGSRPELAMPR